MVNIRIVADEPTELELELARTVGTGIGANTDGIQAIALALAHMRKRHTSQAVMLLETIAHALPSEHMLAGFRDGWTPTQVHELVTACKLTHRRAHEALELLPDLLSGKRR